jgi:RNA polymerase sigma-70 factor, ECF subfamily
LDPDERKLVRLCLQRDENACEDLVEAYARMVGTVILRATGDRDIVEDLAQETFLRVFRGLPYFDGRAKLSTWIYTIAHRVAMDHRRQAGHRPEEYDGSQSLDGCPSSGPNPESAATRSEFDRIIHDQLGRLPDKYRLPLVYAAIDELDYETIARMLKVRPGTVKTLVFRGRRLLKERVDGVLGLRKVREA